MFAWLSSFFSGPRLPKACRTKEEAIALAVEAAAKVRIDRAFWWPPCDAWMVGSLGL
jgi:hypothetical protein